jgi:YggT family protein
MLRSLFDAASSLISVYSLVCVIRVLLSWIPEFEYTQAGRILARICDPYLNWFRRFSFTRIGTVDFSPVVAIGVLSVIAQVLPGIGVTGHISIGIILAGILAVVWSFFSFFLIILILALAIRLLYDIFNRYGYSQFWTMLDRFINPSISRVSGFFGRGKPMPYRTALILTLLVMIAAWILLHYGVIYIRTFFFTLPV